MAHGTMSSLFLVLNGLLVINSRPATRQIIHQTVLHHNVIDLTYHEIDHVSHGFGLCHARNRGLEAARGDFIAYLDDDNCLDPTFVAETLHFFRSRPHMQRSMARQRRRRDIIHNGQTVRRGNDFEAPKTGASIDALVRMQAIFDSNGFCHCRSELLRWQPV